MSQLCGTESPLYRCFRDTWIRLTPDEGISGTRGVARPGLLLTGGRIGTVSPGVPSAGRNSLE
jgi:hypothetical protein